MKYICVFCSANDLEEKYTKPAIELGKMIPAQKYGFVWGGSDMGLMKVMADTVQDHGGTIVGVSVEHLRDKTRKNANEMFVMKTLAERKSLMIARADAFVVLVGGIGTLDEVTEIVELRKHKLHDKPIVFLNTDNFYEGLKVQLQKMKDDGFIKQKLDDLCYFADSPKEAMEFISKELSKSKE